jgi:HEAT repeat protein
MRSARILRELAALTALVVCAPETARAITWPDVADSVERDLAADDVATRLAAARKLSSLGRARGAALAILAMDDGDEDVRLVAADAAIRLKAQGATERASAWLNAPSARTRRKACEVAGSMPNARAVAALARALGDPNAGVRIAAAWALGRQSPTEAVAPLLGRLDDADPAVRIAITTALTRLHDPRAVIPLIGKVGDSSIEVRQAVVRALGELGDLRASSPLVAALRDGSVDVRREAVTALGLLRAADAADAIAGLVPDHSTPLRLAALAALARIATPEAISRLVAALGASDEAAAGLDPTPVREALASAGPSAIAALHACLLASKSPGVASGAAWVLGALRAHAEAPTIVASLRAGWLPPAFAMRALAGAGTSAEAPVVLEFVTDPSAVVRGEAMSAAMALLDPTRPDGRAVEPLAAALADSRLSSHEHARVARLLGRTGARRVAPLLASWVRSGDPELRLAAIDALGALGPAGADEALLDVLRSSDPSLRLRAAEALSLSGGSAALTSILAQLDADEEVDRAALVTAAGGILARIPSVEAVGKLEKALLLSVGPERDALLVAIGRAPVGVAVRVLGRAARSEEPMDRRAAAAMLSAHPGDPDAIAAARGLLADREPGVRAQAAWSLGTIGDASDMVRLDALTSAPESEIAANAVAAIGHIAAREHAIDAAAQRLCPMLDRASRFVRTNALAGLAASGARCPDGAAERRALAEDPDDEVRGAAARAVATAATAEDQRALERCARNDASVDVASRCRGRFSTTLKVGPVLVFVVPQGSSEPRPDCAYGVVWEDGMLRLGSADRRGAFFEPMAPEGQARLVNLAQATREKRP